MRHLVLVLVLALVGWAPAGFGAPESDAPSVTCTITCTNMDGEPVPCGSDGPCTDTYSTESAAALQEDHMDTTARRDRIVDFVLRIEGGHVDDPRDAGGETCWGVTEAVARRHGWAGPMRDLTPDFARRVYVSDYWTPLRLDDVLGEAGGEALAAELFECAVNCGPGRAATWLQRALNGLNRQATLWPDLVADGSVGARTLAALAAWSDDCSGPQDAAILVGLVNVQQGAHYLDLAIRRGTDEAFLRGWIRHRVLARPELGA